MASSSSSDGTLNLNTILHMITVKLSSTNHLLWKNQMLPLLSFQNLLSHVDGTSSPPSPVILRDEKSIPNPVFESLKLADPKAIILLHASLSEEALSEVIGLPTARDIWAALDAAYSNMSIERIQNLRDQLRLTVKGSSPVADFGRKFKTICDQLSAIGHPVADTDKLHWFLCGLGPSFETFSTVICNSKPAPAFRDLVVQAENHELFLRSIHGAATPTVAFSATSSVTPTRNRGGRSNRNAMSSGRGRGRRPPHYQLCRTQGHYASACPSLATFAAKSTTDNADLASAFHAQCHVTTSNLDWFVDLGATDHMAASLNNVHHASPVAGDVKVTFGNGPDDKANPGQGQK